MSEVTLDNQGERPRTAAGAHTKPPYELHHALDDSSWSARENLHDIISRELLGPLHGDEEILLGAPDAAYLLGAIAPVRINDRGHRGGAGSNEETQATSADEESLRDLPTELDSNGPGLTLTDEAAVGSIDDHGENPDDNVRRGMVLPSSMGLRFQVPRDLASVTVRAEWGEYKPSKSDDPNEKSARFQRTPQHHSVRLPLHTLEAGRTHEFVLKDSIKLRVDVFDDADHDRTLVEVALCNDMEVQGRLSTRDWLFQTQLYIEADGTAAFLPVHDYLQPSFAQKYDDLDDEVRRLNVQYRDKLEFAIGRTCSVEWVVVPGARRATQVRTTWIPMHETPQTLPVLPPGTLVDMVALSRATVAELRVGITPLIDSYTTWLEAKTVEAKNLPEHLQDAAFEAIHDAKRVRDHLAEGLDVLLNDPMTLQCFHFMNHVMAEQRLQSQVAELRTQDETLSLAEARAHVETRGPGAHSWRAFQLAFILMQLPLLLDPAHQRRSGAALADAQLLFFPTGGGKTEAYLGLAAFTFAIRRRQGVIESPEGPLDGNRGVAVIMRYTLRLLTSQQFQRATTLMCAAEKVRQANPEIWGERPFRIGLWVGTDVSPKYYDDAAEQISDAHQGKNYRLNVLQFSRCPWCGRRINTTDLDADKATRRVRVFCSDDSAVPCPYSRSHRGSDGLPVVTVDEEIYRLAPDFVIATVDKFARLAREGQAATLFGYTSVECPRHGFAHPDGKQCRGQAHPKEGSQPAATPRPVSRLRPPDLIIQDELHLIAGALGSTVGLFEVAVDVLASWKNPTGQEVRPLVVASTATVRRASSQVSALFGRGCTVFPPQVLDAADTYFSQERPVSPEHPGRRYVGISSTGVRLTAAQIRVTEVLLAGGQLLLNRGGKCADPYLTMVGYFSATRELAGMARYLNDDVQTLLRKGRRWSALPGRFGTVGELNVAELTSRYASSEITKTLDSMAGEFSPERHSEQAYKQYRRDLAAEKAQPQGKRSKRSAPDRSGNQPFDVVLATSMLQVGVDVPRLGLMLVVGQPKNTSEYIQASSRVGRSADRPGLVVTLANWARPRDLAHFEQFRHYHDTFYSRVEALSLTPFSITNVERGAAGILVSALRVAEGHLADGLNHEIGADNVAAARERVSHMIDRLVNRAEKSSDEETSRALRATLTGAARDWADKKQASNKLAYERLTGEANATLILSAEEAENAAAFGARQRSEHLPPFKVPNSMREVQSEINILLSPASERLLDKHSLAPTHASGTPPWRLPDDESGNSHE